MACQKSIKLLEDIFDYVTGENGDKIPIKRFTWSNNSSNIEIQVITYGATITSIKIPDKNGAIADVVLGFNNIAGYQSSNNPYFGATIGRVANRIGYAKFSINGQQYQVSANNGEHQLHGGFKGFDKVVWEAYTKGTTVVMSYDSPDNEEGFPGNVLVNLTFVLTDENEFKIDYTVTSTKPTYVNLTNHSYFNLAGDTKGAEELYKHVVCINADSITEVDSDAIPTGKILPVAGTIFDLQVPKILGDVISKVPNNPGYDHNFCVNKGTKQGLTFIARVYHPGSGRTLEVYSDQPGVQFYTSNFIPPNPKDATGDLTTLTPVSGKNSNYYMHGAFCLETQNYPDAANHKNFPNAVLHPGETYKNETVFKFYIQ